VAVAEPSAETPAVVVVGRSTSKVQCTRTDEQAQENAMWNPVSVIGKGKPEKARMCLLKRMTAAESEIQSEAAAAFWRAAARADGVGGEAEEEAGAEGGRGGELVLSPLLLMLLLLLLGDGITASSLAAGPLGCCCAGEGEAMFFLF